MRRGGSSGGGRGRGLIAAALLTACSGGDDGERGAGEAALEDRSIEEVLAAHTGAWMAIPRVVGTGIGECGGAPCIKVFVSGDTAGVRARIPEAVEGYAVRLEPTEAFRPRRP